MYRTKIFIILSLAALVIVNAMSNEEYPALGGVTPLNNLAEAERELNASLTKLSAGEGPNYKLGKIHSATSQVVQGISYKIVADLVDEDGKTKKCNVSIWSRPWLKDGIEITFECEGEEKVVRKHSA